MRPWRLNILAVLGLLATSGSLVGAEDPPRWYGVLQGTRENAEKGYQAGWRVAVVPVSWDGFEPQPGKINEDYVKRIQEQIRFFRALGYRLQIDLGLQYPPGWVFNLAHSRYRNQYGDDYDSKEPGRRMPNLVFNQEVRDRAASYIKEVFARLGNDWDWVRLGGGFYGEVNYPLHRFDGKSNCYWAFDDLAQGKAKGLAQGIEVNPSVGWIPGTVGSEKETAENFLQWYLGALQNYHDWQIQTVRQWYAGEICMLYGSWGIRPGGIEAALATRLDGSSPAEKVGEIQTGYDWSRMVGGIRDPKVIVYCTWIDAPEKDCDDAGANPARWSPVHWLASLAAKNPLRLKIWGENTGHNNLGAMRLTFARVKEYGLMGVMWAFEPELFAEPNPKNLATFEDFSGQIKALP